MRGDARGCTHISNLASYVKSSVGWPAGDVGPAEHISILTDVRVTWSVGWPACWSRTFPNLSCGVCVVCGVCGVCRRCWFCRPHIYQCYQRVSHGLESMQHHVMSSCSRTRHERPYRVYRGRGAADDTHQHVYSLQEGYEWPGLKPKQFKHHVPSR
jgi:hypothetical protein